MTTTGFWFWIVVQVVLLIALVLARRNRYGKRAAIVWLIAMASFSAFITIPMDGMAAGLTLGVWLIATVALGAMAFNEAELLD